MSDAITDHYLRSKIDPQKIANKFRAQGGDGAGCYVVSALEHRRGFGGGTYYLRSYGIEKNGKLLFYCNLRNHRHGPAVSFHGANFLGFTNWRIDPNSDVRLPIDESEPTP